MIYSPAPKSLNVFSQPPAPNDEFVLPSKTVYSPTPKSLTAFSQPSTSTDEAFLPTKHHEFQLNNSHLIKVKLDSGYTTLMGKRVHDAIVEALSDRNKLEFEKEWLCKNAFRFTQCEFSQMIELELAFLFELLFEAIGIDPSNFPFMSLVNKTIYFYFKFLIIDSKS